MTVNTILEVVAKEATKKHGTEISVDYLSTHRGVPKKVKHHLTGEFSHSRIIAVQLISIHTSLRNKDIAPILNYKHVSSVSNARFLVRKKLKNNNKEFTEYYKTIVNSLNQQI